MDILWELHPLTVRDVKARLGARSAYTTVMTTMSRLAEKGVLNRHREGLANYLGYASMEDGTYELCGPKVQGNPERKQVHMLIRHGCEVLEDAPRDWSGLREYLSNMDIEGIVWHHKDGRMVKIKGKDFGLKRRPE